ncbi:RNA polymerase sigma-70 factor, ECF subfamily [Anaerovirgula multivorans]|uniref:RNA polymerase sigma-70 factor, ECF subfamily n=1 Tax=Anaerovirgula multivorans TaxID=312168 RepID=A0A239F7I0_9FIRM|nr:sigma-70 family RNA polymerase sigma factor [Anaerovirgula multivorans]SNS52856.1 RNA polymerase sigma-70 factor, ECF subfamily [Anaerovirgula multivorans]
MKITEENFIDQMKIGNEGALEYVVDNYAWILKTVLKKHLFSLVNFYEECMNDCILAIWENIHYYDPKKSSFKNWIGGIAKYKSIDYVRKYLKDLENENIEDLIIPVEDYSLIEILTDETSKEIKKMLQSLSEEDRKIFHKLYFEDRDMDEISKDTGLSKPILYNRISRGKKKLRGIIGIEGGYENEKL